MTKKQKKMLRRVLISAAAVAALQLLPLSGLPALLLHLVPYGIIGHDVLRRAALNIVNGQVFDENFLMAVATLGAFGVGEYVEGVAVMLFYQVGELFQSVAVGKSRKSIAALMDIRPDSANVEQDGHLTEVDPEEVAVGQIIVIKPGERVPLDGIVREGSSTLDTAALTGESRPRSVSAGQDIVSGCVNLTGLLRVEVTKPYDQSTVAKILELVENSAEKKAKAEHFITRFARWYTPAVVYAALALAVLPPLLGLGGFGLWFYRALTFLVVSCPCALVISIPLSFFGGIGGASRQGILIKGGNYLEALAEAEIAVFDKTGTLTRGSFSVTELHPVGCSEQELLTLAALAESFSDHPIARSIRAAAGELDDSRATDAQELAGEGVRAIIDGKTVLAGSEKLMARFAVPCETISVPGSVVHVAADGGYMGWLLAADEVKPTTAAALRELKASGIRKTVMLTGDSPAVGQAVGSALGLDEVHAGLLPADKVEKVEKLLENRGKRGRLIFVGDGINDAPVLARADIGVAMGAMGSDAAIEAADVVLMDDDLTKLAAAMRIARKTGAIVRQNIVLALGVKFLVLALTPFGYANMWLAVFADVGVCVLAILNAGRTLKG